MARGQTLRQMISDLRDELRRANSPAASPDDTASLRRTLNHVYYTLYYAHDWPFLLRQFDPIPLVAGQRSYDMPDGLDTDRIIRANVQWAGQPHPIQRGVNFEEYADYDPETSRTSPIMKWDVRFTGEREQLECWPTPDGTDQSLRFYGVQKCNTLVNDNDTCRIESEIVILYAAAELSPKDSPDKEAKLELAKELLRQVKLRGVSGGEKSYQIGLGHTQDQNYLRARSTVRVAR